MTSGLVTAAKRKAKTSSIWTQKENRFVTNSGCFGSNVSPFHQRGPTSGSVRHQTVIFRRWVATRVAASSTAITTDGAKYAMKTNSTGSLNSPKRCQIFGGELIRT